MSTTCYNDVLFGLGVFRVGFASLVMLLSRWQKSRQQMNDVARLKDVIREWHGCESVYLRTVPVVEQFNGEIVLALDIGAFALWEHPTASLCFAWGYYADSTTQLYKAVLAIPPVNGPHDAIKAALVAEWQKERRRLKRCQST